MLPIRAEQVKNQADLARYIREKLGCPALSAKEIGMLRKHCNDFFDANPQADWQTLCKVVDWCKAHKVRPKFAPGIASYSSRAWADGYLPEFDADAPDPKLEARINDALKVEKRPEWRNRLLGAEGMSARSAVFDAWRRTQTGGVRA